MVKITIKNETDQTINVALKHICALHFQNGIKPGETMTKKCGRVWFTVEAHKDTIKNRYSATQSAAAIAGVSLASVAAVIAFLPASATAAIAAGVGTVAGETAAAATVSAMAGTSAAVGLGARVGAKAALKSLPSIGSLIAIASQLGADKPTANKAALILTSLTTAMATSPSHTTPSAPHPSSSSASPKSNKSFLPSLMNFAKSSKTNSSKSSKASPPSSSAAATSKKTKTTTNTAAAPTGPSVEEIAKLTPLIIQILRYLANEVQKPALVRVYGVHMSRERNFVIRQSVGIVELKDGEMVEKAADGGEDIPVVDCLGGLSAGAGAGAGSGASTTTTSTEKAGAGTGLSEGDSEDWVEETARYELWDADKNIVLK